MSAFRLLTCEHGGKGVPAEYETLFAGHENLLDSHRGWDPGALSLYERFVGLGADAAFHATVTRLLVDLNRAEHNPRVFSVVTRVLPAAERERLLVRYHRPHRQRVASTVADALERGADVLHIGVHSFTPVLGRSRRDFDVGILYDPSRPAERGWARRWARRIETTSSLRVRLNRPYRGTSDGLTTTLRQHFGERYLGIELEVNQALWDGSHWAEDLVEVLTTTLREQETRSPTIDLSRSAS